MIVDIMTRKQIKDFIIREVKNSSEFHFNEIEKLRKKILKLEEEIKVLNSLYRQRELKGGTKRR